MAHLNASFANDDTQRLLRESVAAFTERESDVGRARRARTEQRGFDPAIWARMAENGWLGILFEGEHGGLGLGFGEAAVLSEELGRTLTPEPVVAVSVLAGRAIAHVADDATKRELLPRIASAEARPALAWQEQANHYEVAAIETVATEASQGRVLHGHKCLVASLGCATAYVVSAKQGSSLGLYWVDGDAPGIQCDLDVSVDGTATGSITFDATPVAHTLGTEGVAPGLERALDEARLCASAELVGVMTEALEVTLGYVKQREQFGQPIGKFQALQHRLVDLWIQTELARSTVIRALQTFERSTELALRAEVVSSAKARCSEAALLVARQGIQLHGGIGYTDACDIGLYLKRALALSSWLGNAAFQRRRFAALAG